MIVGPSCGEDALAPIRKEMLRKGVIEVVIC